MITNMDKAKAVIVATELFKAVECVNLQLGLIQDKAECEECCTAFLILIEDILNGTEPSLRDKDNPA